jgi:hypothetical protein
MLSTAPQGGDVAIIGRHYSVRNGLDAVLTSACQRVTREPAFPTPVPGQERRRADLRLHAWEERRDLYIDIVCSSPLTVANLLHFVPGGAAARAAQDKQTRYAVLLSRQQPPVAFQAFAFETFGGLHADALAFLQRLQGLLNQPSVLKKMWRDILSFVGSVSLLRPLWVASWPLAGCDS